MIKMKTGTSGTSGIIHIASMPISARTNREAAVTAKTARRG
jgi:hypothetical protein